MLRYAMAVLALLAVAGCEEEEVRPPTVDPAITDQAQSQCLADGGQWLPRADSGANFCQRFTTDGGQACRTRDDCSTQCLARSKTCAPVEPMFGCNEVIASNGLVSTLCVE